MFATFGGAGSTLVLVVVMVMFCKSQRMKKLSQLSLVPDIFGINEPIIFGLPIILKPLILIPFVVIPTINIILAYFSMDWGLVPLTNGIPLPWATPIIFSGFLVSGWQEAVLQALLFVLDMVLYYPFVKVMDSQYLDEEAKSKAEEVTKKFLVIINKFGAEGVLCGLAMQYDQFGEMAAQLAIAFNDYGIPAAAAMSKENNAVEKYKDAVPIIKMPKKGGIGLNDSFKNMALFVSALAKQESTTELAQTICF